MDGEKISRNMQAALTKEKIYNAPSYCLKNMGLKM